MRRLFGILVVPAILLAVFEFLGPRTGTAQAPPPPEPEARPAVPPGVEPKPPPHEGPGDPPAATLPVPATAQASPPADLDRAEVATALDGLRACAAAGQAFFPEPEVTALRAILDRRPDLADVVAAALDTEDTGLRDLLAHVFYRIANRELRARLLAALKDTDRAARRAATVLADRSLLLSALQIEADPALRRDLLGRLTAADLGDVAVLEAVRRVAERDDDPAARGLAISRLGLAGPAGREPLARLLADPSAPPGDRVAAAAILSAAPDRESAGTFLALLDADDPALVRFAALGLRAAGDAPGAPEALRELILDETGDLAARQNAAESLAAMVRLAGPGAARRLEPVLVGTLADLERRDGQGDIAAVLRTETDLSLPGRYDSSGGGAIVPVLPAGGAR